MLPNMSTNIDQNEPKRNVVLPPKPNKLPPPPPLPPKYSSPSQSTLSLARRSTGTYSYTGGGGSEYAESVCGKTFSTHSLQPDMTPLSPNISQCMSSQSVCSRDFNTHNSCVRWWPQTPTHCLPCDNPNSNYLCSNGRTSNCQMRNHPSPASSYHSIHCQQSCHHPTMLSSTCYNKSGHYGPDLNTIHNRPLPHKPTVQIGCNPSISQMSPDLVDSAHVTPSIAPRIPRERKQFLPENRPRALISPLPDLKRSMTELNVASKYYEECSSSHYRRHIETDIERLFKYVKEREVRRSILEEGTKNSPRKDVAEIEKLKNSMKALESRYLRNFRVKVGPEDFDKVGHLGSGFIGEVWLVKKRTNRGGNKEHYFAMKKLSKDQVTKEEQIAHVMAERDILAEADNEWFVKLFYSFQDSCYLYFILEYIPGGDMMSLLQREAVLKEEDARFYIAEISLALQFVHSMNFIHRDIKPDNILIDRTGHIKLTDFGLCTGFRWTHDKEYYRDDNQAYTHNEKYPTKLDRLSDKTYDETNGNNDCPTITRGLTQRHEEHSRRRKTLSCVGSPQYIAPEVLLNQLQHNGIDERLTDWWSVGVILYEMVFGHGPFIDLEAVKNNSYDPDNDSTQDVQNRIINFSTYLKFPPEDGYLLLAKKPIKESTKSLIRNFLCDSKDRICRNGIEDLKKHPFFDGVDWVGIRKEKAPIIPTLDNERDLKYFEPAQPSNHPDTLLESIRSSCMINDFTYHNFWPNSRIQDDH